MRLGAVLVALTAVNVYVFFFRADTSVKQLMQPSSTGRLLVEEKTRAVAESVPSPTPARSAGAGKAVATGSAGGAPAASDGRTVEGTIGPNEILGAVFAREGFGSAAGNIIKALSRLIDPKTIRPGDRYAFSFDEQGLPESFEYMPSPVVRYIVSVQPDGAWLGRKEEKPLTVRIQEAGGTIDSSLYESIQRAGESSALVALLVDLFAWDINFYIDTHPGDHWKVVVEKHYLGDKFYKYGNILAAEYGGRVGTHRAFYWASGSGPGRYYDDRGQSVAKAFLKSPLRFVRISSKFDRKRFHPILHRTKAHLGVDYAAPIGTPIWASASGKIVECAMKPGSGNTVVIAHGNGLATRYYHLSRFAPGMKVGRQVRQKEVIGYVGTTGLSTGPHLHFALTQNGAFVDPTRMQVVREAPVRDRAAFLAAIKGRVEMLKGVQLTVAAKN